MNRVILNVSEYDVNYFKDYDLKTGINWYRKPWNFWKFQWQQ